MYKIIKVSLAIASVICLFDMPYGYFELYRYLALSIFIFLALKSQNDSGWFLIWLISAMLVQPFMKISFGKEIWNLVNVSWAFLLLFSSISREDYIIKIQQSIRCFFIHPAVMLILGFIWFFGVRYISVNFDKLISHSFEADHFYIHSTKQGSVDFSCDCDQESKIEFDSWGEAEEFKESIQTASLNTLGHMPFINKLNMEKYGKGFSFLIMSIWVIGNGFFVWKFISSSEYVKKKVC
jgi:hypothetical protein